MAEYEIYTLDESGKCGRFKEGKSSLLLRVSEESVPRVGEQFTLMIGEGDVSTRKYVVRNVDRFTRVLDNNPKVDFVYDTALSVLVSGID